MMRSLKIDLLIAFCLLALALTLASCAAPVQPTQLPADVPDLANTAWKLESFGPKGAETPVLEGYPLTLSFEDEMKNGGSSGCNSYSGQYTARNGVLSFSQIASTLMACADQAAMQQETGYHAALNTTGSYQLSGDRLTVEYDNGQQVLNFVKQASS